MTTNGGAARPMRWEQPPRLRALALIVLVVSLVPYLCGYLLAPPGQSFLGALNNVGDLSQYLAAIRQGDHGAWRYTDQFTPDHARALIMYIPYLLAGHFSLGLPTAAVFQILRLACAAAALAALAAFCRLFVGPFALRAAWLFVILAGGLYWLALPLAGLLPQSIDLTSLTAPEFSPLMTILISPHESLGLAAELFGFRCILLAAGAGEPLWSNERPRGGASAERRIWLIAGGAASFLVLALSYPFLLPTVGLVLLTYAVVSARSAWYSRVAAATKKRQLRAGGVFFMELRTITLCLIPAGIVGLYFLDIFHRDPLWSHSGLAQVGRPDAGVLLFAFGPLAVGAYAGVRKLRATRRMGGDAIPAAWAWFPLIWASANAGTLLLPIWQQGRQALGLSVPLALLSFFALAGTRAVSARERIHLPPLPASVLVFSSPLLLALYTAVAAGGVNDGYYTPSGVLDAVRWLGDNATKDDVVFSSAGFGNLVPEYCACHVLVGQNFQSFDLQTRQKEVHAFYAARSPDAARRALFTIVRREGITLIVFSPLERGIGHIELHRISGFILRYSEHGVTIFGRPAVRG